MYEACARCYGGPPVWVELSHGHGSANPLQEWPIWSRCPARASQGRRDGLAPSNSRNLAPALTVDPLRAGYNNPVSRLRWGRVLKRYGVTYSDVGGLETLVFAGFESPKPRAPGARSRQAQHPRAGKGGAGPSCWCRRSSKNASLSLWREQVFPEFRSQTNPGFHRSGPRAGTDSNCKKLAARAPEPQSSRVHRARRH
jgi:hypothetical protein